MHCIPSFSVCSCTGLPIGSVTKCIQPPRSTHLGHPSVTVSRRNVSQPKDGDAFWIGSTGGYNSCVCVWQVKLCDSLAITRAVTGRFRDEFLHNNAVLYFWHYTLTDL